MGGQGGQGEGVVRPGEGPEAEVVGRGRVVEAMDLAHLQAETMVRPSELSSLVSYRDGKAVAERRPQTTAGGGRSGRAEQHTSLLPALPASEGGGTKKKKGKQQQQQQQQQQRGEKKKEGSRSGTGGTKSPSSSMSSLVLPPSTRAPEERGLGATALEVHMQTFDYQTRRLEAALSALF